jgi:hypothetical protein
MITTVTRKHRHEMERAIADLLQRGFTIIYGPELHSTDTVQRGSYNYRRSRYESLSKGTASCWIAKLERKDKNNKPDKEGKCDGISNS